MSDPSLKWRTVKTKHFAIHFYEGEEEVASKLTGIAEEAYEILSKKFDARPWGRTEVVVTDMNDASNGFTQVLPYNHILLRVAPPSADNILADYDDWLRELFLHEYTHVIHLTDTRYPAKLFKFLFGKLIAPNGLTPGWVTEGIATYFETAETTRGRGRASFTEMLLRTDILQGKLLHLDQMAGTQYEWPSWLAQYLYGVAFWRYLADTYGEEKITEFSHKYGASLWFYSLNNKAKRVFKDPKGKGESFYRLWGEWKEALEKKYSGVKREVEKKGIEEGAIFLNPEKGESFTLPSFSPDGKFLAYTASSIHHPSQFRLRDLETGKERILLKKRDLHQIGFSPDGKKIIVSNNGNYKKYYQYADLHEIDLATGKVKKLTKGKRARAPDFSPDGKKILAVLQGTDEASLGVYDTESKEWKVVFHAPQIDHPRWLADGRSAVISIHRNDRWDLSIVDLETGREKKITANVAVEDRPAVDPKNGSIYFSSDVTGIPNIYRYDPGNGRISQITNVLTGAFAPSVSPDGTILFQYYNGKGYELRRLTSGNLSSGPAELAQDRTAISLRSKASLREIAPSNGGAQTGPRTLGEIPLEASRKYNPFRRLFLPTYILPNAATLDNAVFLSAAVGGNDPLYRHIWFGDVTFRTDNQFVGFDLGYTYNRFLTPVSVGFSDFAVSYGDVFGFGTKFFEERRRAYGVIGLPLGRQGMSLGYFFENRGEESGLPAGTTLSTLGNYAGFIAQYSIGKTSGTAAGISPERGGKFTANLELTDSLIGASEQLEQQVVWGDARTFIPMPFAGHHVLALRAAGGAAFGDQLLQGNFGLGGSIGESPFAGVSTRVFTLRGLPLVSFSRDRAWVASAEYRLPLFRVQRGIGTLPFAMNSAHFSLFADVGDAFNRGNLSFRPLLGVGAELRGDFVVSYALPIMGRLGYGIILTNRDRIVGLTDPYTGADIRNGILILEIGTSF